MLLSKDLLEAAKTVRIRGKFTAQRMPTLRAVVFFSLTASAWERAGHRLRDQWPDHKEGAGLTLSCLQPGLSR